MEHKIIEDVKTQYMRILGENLGGIYVHGSIALGCFRWECSDIDYIVVVNSPLTMDEKLLLMQSTYALNRSAPPKGIEMSVVLLGDCQTFVHPCPFELHFSIAHAESYAQNSRRYCEQMHGEDPDLAAHFTIIRRRGYPLCGESIACTFGPVPREAYFDSIHADIQNAEADVSDNPVYVILNVCRVLAYVREGLVLSKKEGGEWGMANLSAQYLKTVSAALEMYTSDVKHSFDEKSSAAFCRYALGEIEGGARYE